jgi:predicted HNH restriction endonuclease
MRKETKEDLLKAIESTKSMQSAARHLKMSYDVFRRLAQHYGVFDPNPSGKGTSKPKTFKTEEDVFRQFNYNVSRFTIKNWLLKEKEYRCEECGLDEWQGKHLVLELEHINGDRKDNRKQNLKLLCPNCHSQTKTFRKRKRS